MRASDVVVSPWTRKRRDWLEMLFKGPMTQVQVDHQRYYREAGIELKTLVLEGLVAQNAAGAWEMTTAGRMLRAMYLNADKEGGPWTSGDLRDLPAMRRYTKPDVEAAIEILIARKIVITVKTPRSIKWDLA